jgi:hypothetical protein
MKEMKGMTYSRFIVLSVLFLFLFSAFALVVLSDRTGDAKSPTAASQEGSSRFPRCVGANYDDVTDERVRKCLRFREQFERYGQENGVFDLGIDLVALMTTAYHESHCRSRAYGDSGASKGGIMQVDNPCYHHPEMCPTVESEISHGTNAYREFANIVLRTTELSGREALWMLWFAYNRGPGTMRSAYRRMQDGMPIAQASQEACEAWRSSRNRPEYTCRLQPQLSDIGVHYADVSWPLYESFCEAVGGHIVDSGAPNEEASAESAAAVQAGAAASPEGGDPSVYGAVPTAVGYRPTHPYLDVPYSVDPSFSATVAYDFSIYDAVPEMIHRLDRCMGEVSCILEEIFNIEADMPQFDWVVSYAGNILTDDDEGIEYYDWDYYCEWPNEHAVNSLAEALDTCGSSAQRDCVCSYTIPDMVEFEEEEVHWAFQLLGLIGMGSATSEAADERIISLLPQGGNTQVSMVAPENEAPAQSVEYRFASVHEDLRGSTELEFRYTPEMAGTQVAIYKEPLDRENPQESGRLLIRPVEDDDTACEINNKIMKFCVVQDQEFLAYDPEEDLLGYQNLVLRFAYLFSSDVSDVRNFEVRDAKSASGTLLISWDKVLGADIEEYVIYYSSDPSVEASMNTVTPEMLADGDSDITALEDPLELSAVEGDYDSVFSFDPSQTPECNLGEDYDDRCVVGYRVPSMTDPEGELVEFEMNKLYFAQEDERFFYILDGIEDDRAYYFSIVAQDVNGQLSPSFNTPDTNERSSADVDPGVGVITSIQPVGSDVVIDIQPITRDMTGQEMDSALINNYKVYCFGTSEAGGEDGFIDLSQRTPVYVAVDPAQPGRLTVPSSDLSASLCGLTAPAEATFVVLGATGLEGYDGKITGRVLADDDKGVIVISS